MSTRLTLTLPPTLGNQTIEVDTKRFSIGRTPENDVVIEDSSLSRRHALIENFEGRFNLSDCGSSNGTFVNGTPITALTELSDWDVLTFGGVGDILQDLVAIEKGCARELGDEPLQHDSIDAVFAVISSDAGLRVSGVSCASPLNSRTATR